MLNISLTGDRDLILKFGDMPASVHAMLLNKANELSIKLQAYIVTSKLNGQVLHQRSGALARSIQREVQDQGDAVYGRVFSSGDVKYAAIQEFGGKTPPHDIFPNKAEALTFISGGKQVFAKVVHHPGSQIPERSYMRTALADQAADISMGLKQAVLDGVRSAA